ncbi:hypothetical protein BBI15_15905 [Planococcus plakortidis]|uniref:Uncharacterized protein n=1 Tax=Planococcus plakortidis TaxID=1038856 RepID=A0A1C7ECS7_9BACL|nr:hypothetical protein [Planococcus plakortidis]ANU21558.1 hypothetical protein BBI15_15905 [Planococcus plakortidis]
MKDTVKEKLQFWQPKGIEWLRGTDPSQIILYSIYKSPTFLELVIIDDYGNKIKITYDQFCTSEFAVWNFTYDTHAGRPDLWVNDVNTPANFSKKDPFFFKILNWSDLKKYRNAPIYDGIWDKPEVHLYSTRDEFFIVVSEYEPKISKVYDGDQVT